MILWKYKGRGTICLSNERSQTRTRGAEMRRNWSVERKGEEAHVSQQQSGKEQHDVWTGITGNELYWSIKFETKPVVEK